MKTVECIRCGGTATAFEKDGQTYYQCEHHCREFSGSDLLLFELDKAEKNEADEYAQRADILRQREIETLDFNEVGDKVLCKIEELREHLGFETYTQTVLFAASMYLDNEKRLSILNHCVKSMEVVQSIPAYK